MKMFLKWRPISALGHTVFSEQKVLTAGTGDGNGSGGFIYTSK